MCRVEDYHGRVRRNGLFVREVVLPAVKFGVVAAALACLRLLPVVFRGRLRVHGERTRDGHNQYKKNLEIDMRARSRGYQNHSGRAAP